MIDNSFRISFDYRRPDEAAIIVYKVYNNSFFGSEPNIGIVNTIVGRKAIALYSELSGKSIEQIEKEAER